MPGTGDRAAPGLDSPQGLLARTWYLARAILADRPDLADRMFRLDDFQLPGGLPNDRYVLATGPAQDRAYIVFDHGTLTTRTSPPLWTTASDIREVEFPPSGTAALDQLSETAETLRQADPDLFEGWRVGETLDVIRMCYRNHVFLEVAFPNPAPIHLRKIAEVLADAPTARAWASQACDAVAEAFRFMRLPVRAAAKALATLFFIGVVPDPRVPLGAGILRTVSPGLGPDDVMPLSRQPSEVVRLAGQFPMAEAEIGIIYEPGIYSSSLELDGMDGMQRSWDVAEQLMRVADQSVAAAREVTSIELFYFGLSDALLHYLAADSIYQSIEEAYGADLVAMAAFVGLDERRVICEERRVTILGSFWRATDAWSGKPNPTTFVGIGAWIDSLAPRSYAEARAEMYDLTLRLVIPRFIRDQVLGAVQGIQGRRQEARAVLTRVRDELVRDKSRNQMLPTEPNFLIPLSRQLANLDQAEGR